ncbi:MAG: iron-sulfur cluster repair di-iron protein [Mangrovibacterium sp.]
MQIDLTTRIGDIVRENFKTARLFEANQIDFCCGGSISLEQACLKKQLDPNQLMAELNEIITQTDPDSAYFNSIELNDLCDYIEKRHHRYVNDTVPFLQTKLNKLVEVHGNTHPELIEIRELFEQAAGNLSAHMMKEELMLFPTIRKLVKLKKGELQETYMFGHIAQMIAVMNHEHQAEGERFEQISALSSGYSCPPDGCNTYRVGYETLREFEQDLHRHIHLENNILFEKALDLEHKLMAS